MASAKQVQAAKRNVEAALRLAERKNVRGPSKMGKCELIRALRGWS